MNKTVTITNRVKHDYGRGVILIDDKIVTTRDELLELSPEDAGALTTYWGDDILGITDAFSLREAPLTPLQKVETAKAAMRDMVEAVGPESAIKALRDVVEDVGRTRTPDLLNQAHYGYCVMALEDAQRQIREDAEEAQFEFDAYTR